MIFLNDYVPVRTDEVIVYDYEHVEEITKEYQNCMDALQRVIDYNNHAKVQMNSNYDGMGQELVEEIFARIYEHLKLLYECCETTRNYVIDSAEKIQIVDSQHAQAFERG